MKHGTYGAYQEHKRSGRLPADIWCRIANAIRTEQRRRVGKCVNGLGWPAEYPDTPGSLYPWNRKQPRGR